MGETDLDRDLNGDFVKFWGISSFLTGSVGNINGLFGINKPFGNPDATGKLEGRPAATKLDVNDDKLVVNPPDKLVARLEGKPEDNPGIKLGGKDVCCPGLDVGGKGNLGIAGPPGMPGPPVRGGGIPLGGERNQNFRGVKNRLGA